MTPLPESTTLCPLPSIVSVVLIWIADDGVESTILLDPAQSWSKTIVAPADALATASRSDPAPDALQFVTWPATDAAAGRTGPASAKATPTSASASETSSRAAPNNRVVGPAASASLCELCGVRLMVSSFSTAPFVVKRPCERREQAPTRGRAVSPTEFATPDPQGWKR